MNTRSKTNQEKPPIYSVEIDFDEASRAWRANKVKLDNGCYKYVCGKLLKNNSSYCLRKPCNGGEHCFQHSKN